MNLNPYQDLVSECSLCNREICHVPLTGYCWGTEEKPHELRIFSVDSDEGFFVMHGVQLSVIKDFLSKFFTAQECTQDSMSTGELEILWELKVALERV